MKSILQHWTTELPYMQQFTLIQVMGHTSEHNAGISPVINWLRRCVLISPLDGEALTTPCDARGGRLLPPSMSENKMIEAAYEEYFTSTVSQGTQEMPESIETFTLKHREEITNSWPLVMQAMHEVFVKALGSEGFTSVSNLYMATLILANKHPDTVIRDSWMQLVNLIVSEWGFRTYSLMELDEHLSDNRNKIYEGKSNE